MHFISLEKNYMSLKNIGEISLSKREIDTISCILSGKSVKSISSFLTVSPRTIETYVRAVMFKFRCNSREGIIQFVEKSEKFLLFLNHYLHLLREIVFKEFLLEINKLNMQNNPITVVIYYSSVSQQINMQQQNAFLCHLADYFQLAGVTTTIEEKSLLFSTSSIPIIGVLYLKEESEEKPVLFLLQNLSSFIKIPKEIQFIDYVNFEAYEECLEKFPNKFYLIIFEILKKLLPSIPIDPIILRFKKRYQIVEDTFTENSVERKISNENEKNISFINPYFNTFISNKKKLIIKNTVNIMKKPSCVADFKFKVALESIKDEKPMTELCEDYGVVSSQIFQWQNILLKKGCNLFNNSTSKANLLDQIDSLHKIIKRLKNENNFLKKCDK